MESNIPADPEQYAKDWIEEILTASASGPWCSNDLWYDFRESFEKWDVRTFKRLTKNTRSRVRDTLRRNGVWVDLFLREGTSLQLFRVLQEETQTKWSKEEVEKERELAEKEGREWNKWAY
jgi:hypothetical protein